MTIASSTNRLDYAGNGSTTVFAYTFKIFTSADIEVILVSSAGVETVQLLSTHYTLSGIGDASGGNVTMVTAPASGENLVVRRKSAHTQETDYVSGDSFPAETHETALDRLAIADQAQNEAITRAMQAPDQDASIGKLPIVSTRANKILSFDGSGDPETSINTTDVNNAIAQYASISGTGITGYNTLLEYRTGAEFDGSNEITLVNSFVVDGNNLFVFREGQLLRKGASYDYTEESTTGIKLNFTPGYSDQFLFLIGMISSGGITSTAAGVTYGSSTVSAYLDALCMWRPSDPTGATDMAPELDAFIEANPGKRVTFEPGTTVLLRSVGATLSAIPALTDIDTSAAKILQDYDAPAFIFDNTGNHGPEIAVSSMQDLQGLSWGASTTTAETTEITLASTASANAHDFVALYSTNANPAKAGGQLGEIVQLINDERPSNKIYTDGVLSLGSANYTTGVNIRVLSKTNKIRLKLGVIESNGDTDDLVTYPSGREECVKIMGYVDPVIDTPEFVSPWSQGLWLQVTAGARVNGLHVRDSKNNATAAGYSYGFVLYGMNHAAHIQNTTVRNCRHPAGTTDGNSGGSSSWYNKGVPTRNLTQGVFGYGARGSLVDSHEEGADNVWTDIVCLTAYEDENGSFDSRLAQSRALRDTFKNVYSKNTTGGISIDNVDHGTKNVVTIIDAHIENCRNGSRNAKGIYSDGQASLNKTKIVLKNVTITGCDRGVDLGGNCELSYENLTITKCDTVGLSREGSIAYGAGLTIDFRDTPYTGSPWSRTIGSGWIIYGDETYVTHLGVTIFKGGDQFPRELFNDADGTGTKYVFHDGFMDVRKLDATTAYAATLSKESGGVFTDLTNSVVVAL